MVRATVYNPRSNTTSVEFAESASDFPLDRWLQLGLIVTLTESSDDD